MIQNYLKNSFLATQMKGEEGSWVSLFIPLFFLLIYLLFSKLGRKKTVVIPKRQEPSPLVYAPPKVEKGIRKAKIAAPKEPEAVIEFSPPKQINKRKAFLQTGWNTKGALKQAFILSEVLRRLD